MNKVLIDMVASYVAENIGQFHQKRIDKMKEMRLERILTRKNPYLYKAKNLNTPEALVRSMASAYMSSAEESIFGNWIENLAKYINEQVYGGYKSSAKGIDIEFDHNGVHHFVSVKSGPNWSNSQSLSQLKKDFVAAVRIFNTSRTSRVATRCIEGCCYGNNNKSYTDSAHEKLCGESFWTIISGEPTLYIDIIEPLGTQAKVKNDAYDKEYQRMITKFTCEFADKYCDKESGLIKWDEIVKITSSNKNKE